MVRIWLSIGGLAALLCVTGCSPQDNANLKQDTRQLGKDIAPIPENAALSAKVLAHLTTASGVDVSGLHIAADHKLVTVSGHVRDAGMKEKVIQGIRETFGVESVVDQLQVQNK